MSVEHEEDESTKEATFVNLCQEYCEDEVSLMSSDESFYEITTSEGDVLSSSDYDDTEILDLALQSAYTCSPKKRKFKNNPASRNSLLLWDKDFVDSEGIWFSLFPWLFNIYNCFILCL